MLKATLKHVSAGYLFDLIEKSLRDILKAMGKTFIIWPIWGGGGGRGKNLQSWSLVPWMIRLYGRGRRRTDEGVRRAKDGAKGGKGGEGRRGGEGRVPTWQAWGGKRLRSKHGANQEKTQWQPVSTAHPGKHSSGSCLYCRVGGRLVSFKGR